MKIFSTWPVGIAVAICLLGAVAVIALGQTDRSHPLVAEWEYGRLVVGLGANPTSTWTQTNAGSALTEDSVRKLSESYRSRHSTAADVSSGDAEVDVLSAVGASGWELVAVQAVPNARWFYFKRLSQQY